MNEGNFVRLAPEETRRVLEEVKPLDLYQPVQDPPLRLRHLTRLRTPRYARLLHPLQIEHVDGVEFVRPSQALGLVLPTLDSNIELWRLLPGEGDWSSVEPLIGTLDTWTVRRIAAVLDPSGLSRCRFYYWEGLGLLRTLDPIVADAPAAEIARLEFDEQPYQSPTLWWSEDRRWFVATHTDSTSSYVGGGPEDVEAILASGELDAMPADLETRVDDWLTQGHHRTGVVDV